MSRSFLDDLGKGAITPTQWSEMYRGNRLDARQTAELEDARACRKMWRALLLGIVKDLLKGRGARIREEARALVFDPDGCERSPSRCDPECRCFRRICWFAGIDAEAARAVLADLLAEQGRSHEAAPPCAYCANKPGAFDGLCWGCSRMPKVRRDHETTLRRELRESAERRVERERAEAEERRIELERREVIKAERIELMRRRNRGRPSHLKDYS